jgi:hypothetical protein
MKGRLLIGIVALAVVTALLAAHGSSVRAQPVASIALPEPRGATVDLYPGCNNIALSFPDGTACESVVDAVTPGGVVGAMWRHDAALNKWEGFSPAVPAASDLLTVNMWDAVWLCVAGAPAPAPTATAPPPPPPATATPMQAPSPTATTVPTIEAPAPIALSGSGPRATDLFWLSEGIAIFHMTHNGSSNFAIWLLNESGQRVDLLVNEIGPFDGRKAVGVIDPHGDTSPGNHLLDIEADGSWSVTIEQPRVTSAPPPPQTFSGRGPDVPPPFMLEMGVARFEMTHDGSSNFAVWLLDREGGRVDLLVNEIGPFQGSTAVGVTADGFDASPGVHYLDIEADGSWTVSVTQ